MTSSDILMICLTAVIATAGVIGAVIFNNQLSVMQGQLDEMRASGKQTAELVEATKKTAEATRASVELARANAESQLRAYISVLPGRFWELDPNHKTAMSYPILNTGETPAYHLRHGAVLRLAEFPLPPDYPFPEIKFSGDMFLPRTVTTVSGEASVDKALTQEEIVTLLKGAYPGTRLYLFGEAHYDTFGSEHYVRFCFSLAGWFEAIPLAEQGNWDAINQAIPRIQLVWSNDPNHNKAD